MTNSAEPAFDQTELPTESQIEAQCLAIQAAWTNAERRSRLEGRSLDGMAKMHAAAQHIDGDGKRGLPPKADVSRLRDGGRYLGT